MSEPIRFYYQGTLRELRDVSPTQTILQHVREDLHCTGTKEGCAEGDCGACTVVIGSLENGKLELKAVNACIQLTPTLDGKALFTVEDLQQADGALHPVQQALVECHGSQCGFCTGYRPIIDAAHRMAELPEVRFDAARVAEQLEALKRDTLAVYSAHGQT